MEFYRTFILVIICIIYICINLVNARSIEHHSEESTQEPKQSLPAKTTDSAFSLDNEESNFYKCHGAPCDEWERTTEKLKLLKVLAAEEAAGVQDENVLEHVSESAQHYNITDTDDLDGCIWLTEDQVDNMLLDKGLTNDMLGHKHQIRKRTLDARVASGYFKKWPMPVNYEFDGGHNAEEVQIIRNAISHIEDNTCVKFRELHSGQRIDDYHVRITKKSTGCHSFVGRTTWKPQQLNLQAACLYNFGVPVHELLHLLGLWHEMQRSDRDDYINVLYQNIGNYATQFNKLNTNNEVEYDVSSVMHYSGKDGAQNYMVNSMETKNKLYQRNMGQRVEMSFNDARSINQAYCSDTCRDQPLRRSCKRGGYQDPKDCSRCRCPPGFDGQYCDELARSSAGCGGEHKLTTNSGTITIESPGYTSPGYYKNNDQCNWQFKAPAGHKVSLEFVDNFSVYCSYNYQCFHWVEVHYEKNKDTLGPRFCCRDTPSDVIVSEGEEMTVLFRANYSASGTFSRRGFRAKVRIVQDNGSPVTSQPTTTTTTTTRRPTTTTSTTTTTQPPNRPDVGSSEEIDRDCVKVDLAVALDSSGSVKAQNWLKLLDFTKDFFSKFILSSTCVQTSVISIGNVGYVNSHLIEHHDNLDYINERDMRYRDEWTNTASALEKLKTEVFTRQNGDRSDAKNVVLLITDGASNKDQHLTIPNANAARNAGISIITIGVGDEVSSQELLLITGNDRSKNLYTNSFNELLRSNFQNDLARKVVALLNGETNVEREETQTTSTTPSTTTTTSTTTSTTTKPTTTTSSTTTTQQMNSGSGSVYKCNFETSQNEATWCGITQLDGDDFDWTITNKATPSDETGATYAHSGTYYIYIEASDPRKNGDKARIALPAVSSSGSYCLSFAYHMYGFHTGTLAVSKVDPSQNSRATSIWSLSGKQGNYWREASVSTSLHQGDRIEFIGRRGKHFSGDIGLDTIRLQPGVCS